MQWVPLVNRPPANIEDEAATTLCRYADFGSSGWHSFASGMPTFGDHIAKGVVGREQ